MEEEYMVGVDRQSHFPVVGYLDPEDVLEARVYELTERFLVLASNTLSNKKLDRPAVLHRLVDEYMDFLEDWQM